MTYHSNLYEEDKFIDICNLTTSLIGLKKDSLANKSRKYKFQIPRSIAAVLGRLEGIHHTVIARNLKRDRTSIYHYERLHEGYYASWKEYREQFNLIMTAYKDLKEKLSTFKDSKGMKRYILQFIKESKKKQVKILITSGEVGCKIITSFQDFSQILKNIKFALKNYEHSISIHIL
tara:strand:- start:727 stop:1254 length:528 start_codon:yes stop_codon:yes gene_type:complete